MATTKKQFIHGLMAAACGALASLVALPSHAQARSDAIRQVEIPAQPLEEALVEIGRVFGVVVVAPEALTAGKSAPALAGEMTAEAALERLLAGSDLTVNLSAGGAYIVKQKVAGARPDTSPRRKAVLRVEDAIVVTARKREENIQDVPISLSVFGDEEILISNFDSLPDYAVRTPNLSFQNNGNSSRTIFTLRGVGGGNIASTGTPVGIYIDEVILNPTGGLRQNDLALLDLERIEVLRGPQGTLFGRNTIGGAINLVSRKPDQEFSGRLTAGAERFGTYYVQGHVNIPILDRVAVLGSFLQRETDGFIENPVTGRNYSNGATGGRIALRVRPIDDLTIDLSAMRNVTRFDGLQLIPEGEFNEGVFQIPVDFQPRNRVESDLFTARIEYAAPHFDIISLTSYNQFDRPEGLDLDASAAPLGTLNVTTTGENFSQEIRLQSNDPDARFIWLVGGYYSNTEDQNTVEGILGDPADPLLRFRTVETGEVENIAAFGNLDVRLTDKLTFTFGGRYSRDDVTLVNTGGEVFEGPSDAFTPKIGLQYQLTEDVLTYFTASRGYRAGGFDTSFTDADFTDEVTSAFDPETAWNYEIGANGSFFNNRVVGRAALFYLDYKDIQSVFFLPPAFVNTLTTNGGAARSIGAEFDVSVYPADGLSFDFNLGLLDAEFTDFDNTPLGDLTGNRLPYAPRVTFSTVGEYRKPVFAGVEGYVRAEYSYRSDQEGRNDNNDVERQPAYDLLNLRIGVATDWYEFSVYGENVLDERYFTNRRDGGVGQFGVTPVTVAPGRPAVWGVRATARF